MRSGRPLRFLTVTLGGWTALRVAMLWPDALPAPLVAAQQPAASVAPSAKTWRAVEMATPSHPGAYRPPRWQQPIAAAVAMFRAKAEKPSGADPATVALALAGLVRFGQAEPDGEAPRAGTIPPPLRPTPLAAASSRLAGSAWLLARGGSGGTLLGGQLGGSQAGARLTYALDRGRRIALAARIATPLAGRGREAALGLEWQPTHAPVRLVAEQRFSLDGGKGGPTLMAIGGIGPLPVAGGFRLESYAQAGAIARDGVEGFADGAARFTRRLVQLGDVRLDAGAGAWGAAQRGAARLDVGPSLGLLIPVAQKAVRVTLDYRQRIAGEARPGSGVALSIGSDF